MKELVFITAVPSDLYFAWETEVLINNYRKFGYSDKLQVLVYDKDDGFREYWDRLVLTYKEVEFFFYKDDGIINLLSLYISVLRPHILKRHFKLYPELEQKAIFYHDTDIVFTKKLDFTPYLQDDNICYLSDTSSYIGIDYLEKKQEKVRKEKLDFFKEVDPVGTLCKMVGIDRKYAWDNIKNSGGAQYLLKNINWQFWEKVEKHCVAIKSYMADMNQIFMDGKTGLERENMGYQSWCGDMWAVLWNLWAEGKETRCPKELDFSWATTPISQWDDFYIYHNAGLSKPEIEIDGKKHVAFFKNSLMFKNNQLTPFDIDKKTWKKCSKELCSYNYLQEILSLEHPVTRVIQS